MSFMSASVSLSVMFLFRFAFRFRFKSSFFVLYLLLVCLPTPPPPPTIYYCYRGTVRKSSHFLHSASHLFQVINKISTVLSKSTKVHPPQKKKKLMCLIMIYTRVLLIFYVRNYVCFQNYI